MFNKEKSVIKSLIQNEKKLLIIGLIAGLSVFLFYWIFFYTSLYKSECKLYAKNIVKSDLVSSYGSGKSLVSESGYSNPLFNLYEILKSENMSDQIYPIIKEKYPEDLAALGASSEKKFFETYPKLISAIVEPSTDIVMLELLWPNKKHAPIILHEIVKQFRGENLDIMKTGESQKREFINKQTVEVSQKLENIRNEIKNYKQEHAVANIAVETENIINQRLDLEKQARVLNSQVAYSRSKLKEFARELNIKDANAALIATGIGTDPYLVKLSQDLAGAKKKLAHMKGIYKDKFPTVVSVQNEINELQSLIDVRKRETVASANLPRAIYDKASANIATDFAITQAEMVSMQTQLETLQESIKELKEREHQLPAIQIGLDKLIKDELALASAYQNIKQKQLEANMKESEVIDNLVVLNQPSKGEPLSFFLLTRFIGFILLGGLIGLVVAYVKQGLEDKWLSINEMKTLTGRNIIGPIPWVKERDSEMASHIINAAYTNIASEIVSKAYLNETYVLSFISNNENQSKSSITEKVSRKIAEMDKSVLLIDLVQNDSTDFDLIKAMELIHKEVRYNNDEHTAEEFALNAQNKDKEQMASAKSLQDKIYDILKDAIKKQYNESNLEIANYQKIETNIQSTHLNDYIASRAFKYIINILKNHYEFIFINSPHGFVLLPEIQTLKNTSEGVVLIASLRSSKQNLINLSNDLSESGIKTLGILAREENSGLEKHFTTFEQKKLLEKLDQELTNAQ